MKLKIKLVFSILIIIIIFSIYILVYHVEFSRHPFTSTIVDKQSYYTVSPEYIFYLENGYKALVSSYNYNHYNIGDNYTYSLIMYKWK